MTKKNQPPEDEQELEDEEIEEPAPDKKDKLTRFVESYGKEQNDQGLDHILLPPDALGKTPDEPPPLPEPAVFPDKFWLGVDYLLHNSENVRESLKRDDENLWDIAKTLAVIATAMAGIYGAIMGGTNLFQGSEMPAWAKIVSIFSVGVKVPVLFLLTLVIVLPPIYVSNAMIGAKLTFRQITTLVLAAIAITTTALASMASVSFFFALTSQHYVSLVLLHVIFFAYAGVMGLNYLIRTIRAMIPWNVRQSFEYISGLWILLYMFVGTQLAWILRPFIGSPFAAFELFRDRTGNFYEAMFRTIAAVFRNF